jgi:hypothetical protein
LFWDENVIWFSKSTNYCAKDKEAFKDYLKNKWLYDKASDVPYNKINNLVKDWDLSQDVIDKYLEWKDSWRLTPKKK